MTETVTTTAKRVGSTGEKLMTILCVGPETVYVGRTAEQATPEQGLPVYPDAVLNTDGPLYAATAQGEAELRILLPG